MLSLSGHKGSVLCCCVYKNYIVSAGYDKIIRIWNAESGTLLHSLSGHDHIISGLDIHYLNSNCDTEEVLILSGSWDRNVCVWKFPIRSKQSSVASINSISTKSSFEASSAREGQSRFLLHTLTGHKNRIKCVKALRCQSSAVALKGEETGEESVVDKFGVSGSDDGIIMVWNVTGGSVLHILEGHSHFILQLALYKTSITTAEECESPLQGCCLASYSSDRTIRLWSLLSGQQLTCLAPFESEDMQITSMTLTMIAKSCLAQLPLYLKNHTESELKSDMSQSIPVLIVCDSENNLTLFDLSSNGLMVLSIPCVVNAVSSSRIVSIATQELLSSTSVESSVDNTSCQILYLTDRGEVGCVSLFDGSSRIASIKHSLSRAVSLTALNNNNVNSNVSSKSSKKSSNVDKEGNYNAFHQLTVSGNGNMAVTSSKDGKVSTVSYMVMCGDEGQLKVHNYQTLLKTINNVNNEIDTANVSSANSVQTADSFSSLISTVKLPKISVHPPKGKIYAESPSSGKSSSKKLKYNTQNDDSDVMSISEQSLLSQYNSQILYDGVGDEEFDNQSIASKQPPQQTPPQTTQLVPGMGNPEFWKTLVGTYGFNRVKFNGGRRMSKGEAHSLRYGGGQVFNANPQQTNNDNIDNINGMSGIKHHSSSQSALNRKQNKTMKRSGRHPSSMDHLPPVSVQDTHNGLHHSHSSTATSTTTGTYVAPVVTMNFESVGGSICFVDEYVPANQSNKKIGPKHFKNSYINNSNTADNSSVGGGQNNGKGFEGKMLHKNNYYSHNSSNNSNFNNNLVNTTSNQQMNGRKKVLLPLIRGVV